MRALLGGVANKFGLYRFSGRDDRILCIGLCLRNDIRQHVSGG